jgi:hypothetical protein
VLTGHCTAFRQFGPGARPLTGLFTLLTGFFSDGGDPPVGIGRDGTVVQMVPRGLLTPSGIGWRWWPAMLR